MPSHHSSSPTLSWVFTKPRQLFLSGQYLCSSLFGFGWMFMGSMLGDLPSYDPHNFSQMRPSDPAHPSKSSPTTYRPTHNRTSPPPNQVISTEATNILLRQFYQQTEEKLTLRPKRAAASDHLTPEQGGRKQLRSCFSDDTI